MNMLYNNQLAAAAVERLSASYVSDSSSSDSSSSTAVLARTALALFESSLN
jgi:hypothetical protein